MDYKNLQYKICTGCDAAYAKRHADAKTVS